MKNTFLANFSTSIFLAASASAATISLNMTDNGSADSTMGATDVAGVAGVAAANWNNLIVNGNTGSGGSFVYDDGTPATGTAASWSSDLTQWRLAHAVSTGDDRMWKGYLDVNASATVTITNLNFVGAYDVYVYFDGANGTAWKVGNYAIGAVSALGEDSESTNWGTGQNTAKLYQLPVAGPGGNQPYPTSPNNSEGNYVLLSGITGSSFTLSATGSAASGALRAPVNGIQIVGTIPEPSSALLSLLGGLLIFRRRR